MGLSDDRPCPHALPPRPASQTGCETGRGQPQPEEPKERKRNGKIERPEALLCGKNAIFFLQFFMCVGEGGNKGSWKTAVTQQQKTVFSARFHDGQIIFYRVYGGGGC